jgi:hypothetical protein
MSRPAKAAKANRSHDLLDNAFRDGANIDEVFQALEQSGDPDPNSTFNSYLESDLPDGRKRNAINLKDPLEWADVDKVDGQPSELLSDQQFAAIETWRQEGADLDEVEEALGASGMDAQAAIKEYLHDPRRRVPARTKPRNAESPDGWEF